MAETIQLVTLTIITLALCGVGWVHIWTVKRLESLLKENEVILISRPEQPATDSSIGDSLPSNESDRDEPPTGAFRGKLKESHSPE